MTLCGITVNSTLLVTPIGLPEFVGPGDDR